MKIAAMKIQIAASALQRATTARWSIFPDHLS
jgi:hypothetical protein